MKTTQMVFRVLVSPFILIAAIVLFILDSCNVNVNPILTLGYKPKVVK